MIGAMRRWKSGRGLLGPLKPLLGDWSAEGAAPGAAGRMRCTRSFAPVLGSAYVRLDARWEMGPNRAYEEIALFGKSEDRLAFWSFTSDGKRSVGFRADGADVHPDAIAFEAQMPAGLARMVYWPSEEGDGFDFAVESRTKAGWNRFLCHHYRRLGDAPG
jgi:hypothetical protein